MRRGGELINFLPLQRGRGLFEEGGGGGLEED